MPDSLDRSDQFFTNVERAMREADLPALSADSREVLHDDERADRADVFNMEKVLGTGGTLEQLTEEARATIKAADLHCDYSGDPNRLASDEPDRGRSPAIVTRSSRVARAAARARKLLEEQPEAIVCVHVRRRVNRDGALVVVRALLGRRSRVARPVRLPVAAARHRCQPDDRAQLVEEPAPRIAGRPPFRSACSRRRRAPHRPALVATAS